MSKSRFIKLSGWAFILGSFAFMMSILGDSLAASVISSILLAVGMLGLRARYDENAGGFGRNILLMGVIGMVLLYMVLMSLWALYVMQIQTLKNPNQNLWILLFGGPAIILLALTLFGLAALRSKPMARLNWLPVFAGIWYPVIYFFIFGYIFTNNGTYPVQYQTAFDLMTLIQFIALCMLGSILLTDTPQEMATA
jgi:hypothetical protein